FPRALHGASAAVETCAARDGPSAKALDPGGGCGERLDHGLHEMPGRVSDAALVDHYGDVAAPEDQVAAAKRRVGLQRVAETGRLHVRIARTVMAARLARHLHQPGAIDARRR